MNLELPYYPRPDVLERVKTIYDIGHQAITMFAARRMGKTMFVQRDLQPAACAWKWEFVYVDLWANASDPERALVEGIEEAVRIRRTIQLPSRFKRAKIKAGPAEVEYEQSDQASTGRTLERRLALAIAALTKNAKVTTLLVIDEFQTLAGGKRADFVAAFRAAVQLRARQLKIFYTGSSRDALNAMFRKRRAPLFDSAFGLQLPSLGKGFVEDRAAIFKARTGGRKVNVKELATVFDKIRHEPQHLNEIITYMLVEGTQDVGLAVTRWLDAKGDGGFDAQWAALTPLQREVLRAMAASPEAAIYSASNCAHIASQLGRVIRASHIQGALRTLQRKAIVAAVGDVGAYEIEDHTFAHFVRTRARP